MAQLPPKVPNMTQNWAAFPHQRMPSMAAPPLAAVSQQPYWVDEFLDFSSSRRGSHRRSVSDSIAFLEAPVLVEEARHSHAAMLHGANGFDRLDDDQLMSMFSDDISLTIPPTVSSSGPSTPSDQNSNNDEKADEKGAGLDQPPPKNEPGEVESSCKNEFPSFRASAASNGDSIIDPKRVKR